jgi:hypothetical protein
MLQLTGRLSKARNLLPLSDENWEGDQAFPKVSSPMSGA